MVAILNGASIPAVNSTANTTMADVIGSKTDTHDGNSLYSRADALYDSIHVERNVYPTLAAGATVISGDTNWALGAYATVIAGSVITNDFHIMAVSIESCNKDGVFELNLYKGAGDDTVTAIRFAIEGGFYGNQVYVIGSEEVAANSQIRARLASSDGQANQATITLSIIYWEHT